MISKQYLAGFIDGEGNISLRKFKTNTGYGIKFRIVLRVTNTNKDILEQMKLQYGGQIEKTIKEGTRLPESKNWKDCFRWVISDKKATVVLKDVHKYLILKKEQSRCCLELAKMSKKLKAKRMKNGYFVKASKKEVIKKLELFEIVKKLNIKGKGFLGA